LYVEYFLWTNAIDVHSVVVSFFAWSVASKFSVSALGYIYAIFPLSIFVLNTESNVSYHRYELAAGWAQDIMSDPAMSYIGCHASI